MEFDNVDSILDFAIANEERAAKMYHDLAEKVDRPGMREAFLEFSKEEARHKARLLKVKGGELPAVTREKVQNLKITEYTVDVEPRPTRRRMSKSGASAS